METRFKNKWQIIDIAISGIAAALSVGCMLYAVHYFGINESGPELVLNVFYIACLVMMWKYFFNRLDTQKFNYWCSICVGATVLLRDILFPPHMNNFIPQIACRSLSVLLLLMLTYFYARKEWKTYSKLNLWMICIVDMVIAAIYSYIIYTNPYTSYTDYLITEVWIRPTITYGLVACFVSETGKD